MFKLDPHLIKNKGNKRGFPDSSILNKDRLMRINKGGLLIINKSILLRNENGYRFHSHQSRANLDIRTQSATIARSLVSLVLYIYKKWNCVDLLTVTRLTLTGLKVFANMGTYITQQAY